MPTQKAIFTLQADWKTLDINGLKIKPYLYHDGSGSWIIDESGKNSFGYVNGTPKGFPQGKRGQAATLGGSSMRWLNVGFPASRKYMVSVWFKPTQADIDSTWSIVATNRGDGWSDKGIHIAMYKDATYGTILNVRVIGTATTDMYAKGDATGRERQNFVAGQWYHVAVLYDADNTNKTQVWVNGVKKLWTSGDANPTAGFANSFTVGDMLTNAGASQYPFRGEVDEVIYAVGDNCWNEQQILDYYNKVTSGEFVDYWTTDGSLQLSKDTGRYSTNVVSWYSPTIDLGGQGKFVDFGYIEATGILPSSATTMTFFTRSSSDGTTWGEWIQVAEDGKNQSENLRYYQIRVDFQTTDSTMTPVLEELKVMEDILPPPTIPLPNTNIRPNDPLYLFRDLETGLDSMGVLNNAYDIVIEEQINAEDNLTFKLPKNDKKRKEIGDEPVEMIAVIGERYYVVKEIIDKRDNDGKLYSEFKCEARWTELRDWYCDTIEVVEVTAKEALETIFASIFYEPGDPQFDWTVGNVEIEKKRTLRSDWADVLSLVREVQNTWGGEVLFDTKTKTVHLFNQIGRDTGVRFYYNKNLKNIERTIDTYDLITRIYPTGKGELDIRTVNNGVPYLENRTWVDKLKLRRKIIPYRWKDERYTIPENLKEDAQKMLDEMSKPKVSYKTSVHDLSALTGHEHESFDLGDIVTAVDYELFDEEIVNRIVRRKYDVRKPENTEVELSQPIKTLADIRSRALDDQIQTLVGSDPLSTTDVQQMTVFNHLLNSRADEGINGDWERTAGTDFTIENVGFSGNWSFKVTPDFGRENTLTQTVEGVSHRSTYTVSAAVATEGDITRGSNPNAFVGIKVIVHYQDGGEPDVHWLAVPDVTNNTPPQQ